MQDPAMQSSTRETTTIVIAIVAVIVAALGGWWFGRSGSQPPIAAGERDAPTAAEPAPLDGAPSSADSDLAPPAIDPRWRTAFDEALAWGDTPPAASSCPAIDRDLAELCAASGFPCDAAKRAAIALAKSPPVASGEIHRLDAIVGNAFHVFRTLGRADTRLLIDAASAPGFDEEAHAIALYRWAASREACGTGDERVLTLAVLDDYAVFALSTLGGQAYLRRRAPAVEGIASFYALAIVDRALREGEERHGLDPRAHAARTRALLRDDAVALGAAYRDALDRMSARWGSL